MPCRRLVALAIALVLSAVPLCAVAAPQSSTVSATTTRLVFTAAARESSTAAANDEVLRNLRGKIRTLQARVRQEGRRNAALDAELTALQAQFNDRLAEINTGFAIERAAFIRAIGGLLDDPTPDVQDALRRYAFGDPDALDQLGELVAQQSRQVGPDRLVTSQSYAALVTAAVRNGVAERNAAIKAWERVLQLNRTDWSALENLAILYANAGRHADSQSMTNRLAEITRDRFLRGASFMVAGNLAIRREDFAAAILAFDQSIPLLLGVADPDSPEALRSKTPNASKEQQAREAANHLAWAHPPLSSAFHGRSVARLSLGDLEAARTDAESAILHARIASDAKGKGRSGQPAFVCDRYGQLGRVKLAQRNFEGAITAFQTAIGYCELSELAAYPTLRANLAAAAIGARQFKTAGEALAAGMSRLQGAEVNAFNLGGEGLLWEQTAHLRRAEGRPDDAQRAFESALAALTDAARLEPEGWFNWPAALERVRRESQTVP